MDKDKFKKAADKLLTRYETIFQLQEHDFRNEIDNSINYLDFVEHSKRSYLATTLDILDIEIISRLVDNLFRKSPVTTKKLFESHKREIVSYMFYLSKEGLFDKNNPRYYSYYISEPTRQRKMKKSDFMKTSEQMFKLYQTVLFLQLFDIKLEFIDEPDNEEAGSLTIYQNQKHALVDLVITLNYNKLVETTEVFQISFEQVLSEVIIHELLHVMFRKSSFISKDEHEIHIHLVSNMIYHFCKSKPVSLDEITE